MDLSVKGLIDLLVVVCAVAAILAVAFAYGRGQYMKQRNDSLRQDVVDYRAKLQDCNTEKEALRLERDRFKDERDQLKQTLEILNGVVDKQADFREIVTQMGGLGGAVSDLAEAMDRHHTEALRAWQDIGNAVKGK